MSYSTERMHTRAFTALHRVIYRQRMRMVMWIERRSASATAGRFAFRPGAVSMAVVLAA